MVAFLKLISAAMCRQDAARAAAAAASGGGAYGGSRRPPPPLTQYQLSKKLDAVPGPLRFGGYLFCLGSLLVGPTLEFRDYDDFVALKGVGPRLGGTNNT